MTNGPMRSKMKSKIAALSRAKKRSFSSDSPPPSAGMTTKSGITARSWNSKTPKARRPCSLSSSRRSAKSLVIKAVDDMASAAPITNPVFQSASAGSNRVIIQAGSTMSMSTDKISVEPTCKAPRTKTCCRIDRNFARLNSSPSVNISNTTPSSPRWRTASSLASARDSQGPSKTPTNK